MPPKELPEAKSLTDLGRIEQMKGYPSYYKVRFGSYRIGGPGIMRGRFHLTLP